MTKDTVAESSKILNEEQYLSFERSSRDKHEYLSGHVYAMTGATREHNLITGNVAGELRRQLSGKPCETYSNDMRVKIPKTGLYTYPDVLVVCGTPMFWDEHRDILINPLLIVEILSQSTEGYDRGDKFKHYRSIETFSEYVLISQDKMAVDHFAKQESVWTILEVDREIKLISVPCLLSFSEIYDRVSFSTDKARHM